MTGLLAACATKNESASSDESQRLKQVGGGAVTGAAVGAGAGAIGALALCAGLAAVWTGGAGVPACFAILAPAPAAVGAATGGVVGAGVAAHKAYGAPDPGDDSGSARTGEGVQLRYLKNLDASARAGAPVYEQYRLAELFQEHEGEQFHESGNRLLICAAEGGYRPAQNQIVDLRAPCRAERGYWSCGIDDAQVQRFRYKFASILTGPYSCDCSAPKAAQGRCEAICSAISDSKPSLDSAQLKRLDGEISGFTPKATPCEYPGSVAALSSATALHSQPAPQPPRADEILAETTAPRAGDVGSEALAETASSVEDHAPVGDAELAAGQPDERAQAGKSVESATAGRAKSKSWIVYQYSTCGSYGLPSSMEKNHYCHSF
ncbi:MAG TPA: hypothetical protein VLA52_12500 [Thermohalobaculum sp.]|nr:hypothetical protein [Thermohalobaculum sp.]